MVSFSFSRSLIRVLLVIPALLLMLGGCQFLDEAGEDYAKTLESQKEEFSTEKKTGTLTAVTLDDGTGRKTHKLVTADGVIYLRSGLINLRKYENREVEMTGKISSEDEVFEVENVVKIGREDSEREMYRNPNLGFSLIYAPAWQLIEKESSIIFTPYPATETELIDRISVTKLENEKKLGAKEWLDASDTAVYSEVVVGPDQLPGIRRTSSDTLTLEFYVARDNAMYRLNHLSIGDDDQTSYRNIFLEMVNSFQFIPFGNTGGDISEITPVVSEPTTITPPPPVPETVEPDETDESNETSGEAPAENIVTVETSGELTQTLESRGFGITMKFPKNWYWGQADSEIHFSDKSLEEGGTILMKLKRGKVAIEDETEICKTISEIEFCAAVKNDSGFENLMGSMLNTISL